MQQYVVVVFGLWSSMIPDDFLKNCFPVSCSPFSVGSDNCSCCSKKLLIIPYSNSSCHFSRQYCFELKSWSLDTVLICLTVCLWKFSKYIFHSAELLMKVLKSIRFRTIPVKHNSVFPSVLVYNYPQVQLCSFKFIWCLFLLTHLFF